MDARQILGEGGAGEELDRLPVRLREAVHANVADDDVHLAMGGDGSAIIATDCCVYHLALTRAQEPRVRRAEYAQVAFVEGKVDHGRAELSIRLEDGSSMLVHASPDHGEQTMQAATVLNLLAVEARRHVPPGKGLAAAAQARRAPRRDPHLPTGARPRR